VKSELLHTREYRLYNLPPDVTVSEALAKVKLTVPGWEVHFMENAENGMVFRLESPLPERLL
jgi:hypothetical protein